MPAGGAVVNARGRASVAAHVRAALDAARLAAWRAAIDAHPAWRLRAGSGFVAEASSLPLASVIGPTIVAQALRAGPVGEAIDAASRAPLMLLDDACWIRRQYAPGRWPPHHAAHGWHQDGALGAAFSAAAAVASAAGAHPGLVPRPIVTCWIVLDACGRDAPGLELALDEDEHLLPPAALADAAVRASGRRFHRPVLAVGDALVFTGRLLHRTHTAPAMTNDRTSIEIRFEETRP